MEVIILLFQVTGSSGEISKEKNIERVAGRVQLKTNSIAQKKRKAEQSSEGFGLGSPANLALWV